MWEVIATALLTHLGKKAIDVIWSERRSGDYPVANQSGNVGYAVSEAGRTVVGREITVSQYQEYESLFGKLYIPDTIQDRMVGKEVALVLVIEEIYQQVFLFEADVNMGYTIDLPYGIYSIFVFLMDTEADDLFDAKIYAIGFPCAIDIDSSNIEGFFLEDHEDIWNLIDDSPIEITIGGPFSLDFILIDTDRVPEFPKFFSEFLGYDVAQDRGAGMHNFVNGVCTKCGCSETAVEHFGWKCKA